ncbi:hypothetical protein [Pseudoprimorskyibacter insulae]|uniref:Histidinol phosphate aminotransferase n=1 Tax=Pseudoprimorskyibacter insulae TaxID=1695997 RepID=A0A2R8B0Y4_9RHOB|nr:hypothetical protein [Pseudoprimorskyibacter insulae]SPF81910.1 hypothetical protein PRI8871_03736 [Pseudoprimorskyibacter insulae]
MHSRPPQPVENYTNPALIMAGLNLMWVLWLVWVFVGPLAVAGIAWILNHLIDRLAQSRSGTKA